MLPASHPTFLKRGDRVDGWTVVRPLGAGTYGAVFQVEKGDQRFALKFAMHREGSGDPARTAARALRELLCLLRVGPHPHIVPVHGHGHWPDPASGWLYVVLDYVEGDTLARWVRKTHPTAQEVVRLFVKLFEALAHVHACGVFHRDLKATNVMVRKDGEPVILDFSTGDAPFADELTDGPLPPGTARYRTPEAVRFYRENRLNEAARYAFKPSDDVYALGMCLYDVLTSLRAEHLSPALVASLMPPAARELNARVPAALSDAAMALIARGPEQRPPTAEAARRVLMGLAEEPGEEWKVPVHRPEDALEAERELSAVVRLPLPFPTAEETPARPVRSRRRLVLGSLLGAVLLVAVAVASSLRGGGPAAPAAPQRPAGAAPTHLPPSASSGATPASAPAEPAPPPPTAPEQPLSAVKPEAVPRSSSSPEARKKPARPTPAPQSPPAPTMKTLLEHSAEFLKQCATATAAAALAMGCASAQLRPAPEDCPEETKEVMHEMAHTGGLEWIGDYEGVHIAIDKNKRGHGVAVFTDGEIESYVTIGHGAVVEGSILKGRLWTGTGALQGRYYEVQLPDGRVLPMCAGLATHGMNAGVPIQGKEGSKPGAVVFEREAQAIRRSRWP